MCIRDRATSLETVEPVWAHKGGAFGEVNDIGDSYVEIDLENQKVWLYKDGRQLLETDCVSGTFGTDNQTPGGVYSIFYMQSPDVLNGPGYSSYVEYWMAFNGNIGLHDAKMCIRDRCQKVNHVAVVFHLLRFKRLRNSSADLRQIKFCYLPITFYDLKHYIILQPIIYITTSCI